MDQETLEWVDAESRDFSRRFTALADLEEMQTAKANAINDALSRLV